MRLFIGVWLSREMRDEVMGYINEAKKQNSGFKWAVPEQLHFTLKFLGEVSAERVNKLETALCRVTTSRQLFELKLGEPGRFPERGVPRILWIGLSFGYKELARLAEAVEDACVQAGFPVTDKPFKPHLTIARAKDAHVDMRMPDQKVSWQSGMNVSGFTLIESKLTPGGAVYRPVREFSFQ